MAKTPTEILPSKSPSHSEQHPVSSSFLHLPGSSGTSVIMSTTHSPVSHPSSIRSPSIDSVLPNDRGDGNKDGKQRVCI